MKKMLFFIIIFILTFSFDIFALEYKTVNVSTSFSENIEFSDIEKVKLTFFGEGIDYVDDASSIISIVELTKDNNYSQTINNIKIVDQSNLFAIVDKDNYGVYNCDITLDTSVIDTANINIHISKNDLPKNEFSTIPSDILEKIIGKNEVNKNEESSNNNNGGNNSTNNNDNDSENEITVGTTKTTTTTIYKEELKSRQEQEEKEKVKKKNNMISTVLFAILGIILLIIFVFVMYKFVTANK